MFLKNILIFLFVLITNISFAQKANINEINKVAENFIKQAGHFELLSQIPSVEKIYNENSNQPLFYIFNYNNSFLIISASKNNVPIKGFSFKNNFNTKNINSEINILISDYEKFSDFLDKNPKAKIENQNKWNKLILNNSTPKIEDVTYGPFLSSIYGQVNCHDNNGNLVNVTNYFTPNNYAAGCVAMTFMEVMRYYNWPRKGTGSYSYTDNYGSSKGSYTANFEENYYNWSLMLNEYDGESSTDQERSELGKLTYHAAVAVSMDFENGGSTSNINRIPNAASKYFRYTAIYKEKSANDFWSVLDTSLYHGIPAQFAVYTQSGAGHAIVGDGIKYVGDEKYYHLNMGWWGDDNGWYQIHQTFNAGGYTNVTAAVLNMIPVPELEEEPILDAENKTAKLEWYYSDKIIAENYELQIKRGPAEWENLTDTLTKTTYVFQADDQNEYAFRIRAKINNTYINNSWSNEVKIKPSDFIINGDEDLTLYPTAAVYKIKVSYQNLSGSIVNIYNMQGSLVFQSSGQIYNNEYDIDISNLQSGMYIIQISNEIEQTSAKFFKL